MAEKPDSIRVTNIQRMCFHDGPGIRTTVFLKGCCLRCPWCSNPENISFDIQDYNLDGKEGVYGRDYSTEDLYKEIIKDRVFWGTEGGVTFSGGEPLMQSDRFLELVKRLKEEDVNCTVETSLFAPKEKVMSAVDDIDHFIVDVKILDDKLCSDILGGNLSVYYDNVNTIYEKKKLKLFRLPLCNEYTFDLVNRRKQTEFLLQYKDVDIQLFAIHGLGESKYNSLGMECWHGKPVNDDDVKEYCEELKAYGLKAEVIRI